MKNQLDPLQTSVEQRKGFHTLLLLINKIKEIVEELKTDLDSIMMKKVSSSSFDSIVKQHSKLISRLDKLNREVNSLNDDGQLSQSSTRIHDDISCVSQSSKRQFQSQQSISVSQKSVKDDLTVNDSVSDVSPQVTQDRRKHRFSSRKDKVAPIFCQSSSRKLSFFLRFLEND